MPAEWGGADVANGGDAREEVRKMVHCLLPALAGVAAGCTVSWHMVWYGWYRRYSRYRGEGGGLGMRHSIRKFYLNDDG